jgi:hypothetical protein
MEYIGSEVFSGCSALTNVVLPKNVVVGPKAFYGVQGTIKVQVSEMETQDLWNAKWLNGVNTSNIVYNYDPNATEEE